MFERISPATSTVPYIASVDLMRGLVMVLMALDHVRWFFTDAGFSPTDLSRTDPAAFFTRWVTHLCAPAFVFLAGTSAFLSSTQGMDRPHLASRLFTRGLWLVFLELTVVRFAWFFNLDYSFMEFGVIWALGWSMVVLSALVYMPMWAIAWIGLTMIFGHNLLDGIRLEDLRAGDGSLGWQGWLLSVLHIPHGPVFYPLVPWVGVMAAGYAFGPVMLMEPTRRKRLALGLGVLLIAAFLLLRTCNGYGDPKPWSSQGTDLFTLLSFLNATKYPPSLIYLLMTLGPMMVLLAAFQRSQGVAGITARFFILFGRVPLFFYLLHLYVIHGLVIVLVFAMSADIGPFLASFNSFPTWWGYSLLIVYIIWVAVVAFLYPVCRWFAAVKARHRGSLWTYYV